VFYRGDASVVIHEPIPTADLTVKDIDILRTRVHDVIEKQFRILHQS
jgi:hypothetical protein